MDKINKLSNAAITMSDEANTDMDEIMPTKKDLIISNLLGIENTTAGKMSSSKKETTNLEANEKENDAV